MKKQLRIFLSTLVMGVCSHVYAEDNDGAGSHFYGSVGVGTIAFDIPSTISDIDNSKSWVATLGWREKLAGGGSIAGEYTYTKNRNNDRVYAGAVSSSYEVETHGLYGVYRTGGDFYLKAKGGALYTDISVKSPFSYDSEVEAAYGLGFGAHIGDGYFESEFTNTKSLTIFSFGVGLVF